MMMAMDLLLLLIRLLLLSTFLKNEKNKSAFGAVKVKIPSMKPESAADLKWRYSKSCYFASAYPISLPVLVSLAPVLQSIKKLVSQRVIYYQIAFLREKKYDFCFNLRIMRALDHQSNALRIVDMETLAFTSRLKIKTTSLTTLIVLR